MNKKQNRILKRKYKRACRQAYKVMGKEITKIIDEEIIRDLLITFVPFSRKDINGSIRNS